MRYSHHSRPITSLVNSKLTKILMASVRIFSGHDNMCLKNKGGIVMKLDIFFHIKQFFLRSVKNYVFGYLSVIIVFSMISPSLAVDRNPIMHRENNSSTARWVPCGDGPGTPNPAAIYCTELGYEIGIVKEGDGGEHSICIFPDDYYCDAWSFMIGRCGDEYSYCAQNGYGQIIKTDGKNPFSPTYPVCVKETEALSAERSIDDDNELGNPLDLMGITDRLMDQQLPESKLLLPESSLPKVQSIIRAAVLPSSFDWRDNGGNWTTPPKDQNSCGSCWAFSAVSATEAAYNLFLDDPNYDLDLAEEYPNSDCLTDNSCCGGWHYNALELFKINGVPDEECLPYDSAFYSSGYCNCFGNASGCPANCPQNRSGVCNEKDCNDESCADIANRLVDITGYVHLDEDTDTIKQALIDNGPLSVCFGTTGGTYWDEIIAGVDVRRCNSDTPGYVHCVTIVGYEDVDDDGYWIIKDNYGTTSFDGTGHWLMGYGECNIQKQAYYVVPNENAVLPPVSDANGPYNTECTGEVTNIVLDGTGSNDPNGVGDDLIYSWSSTCPGAYFDDSSYAQPTLTIDTTASAVCPLSCEVTLRVSKDNWPEDVSTAAVTITDTSSPELYGVPEDMQVECDSVPAPASVTAIDNCDPSPTINYIESRTDGDCLSNYTLTRTWEAIDGCGNSTTATQIITVEDNTPPVITCNTPSYITPPDAPISFMASALDNCDSDPLVEVIGYDCFFFTKKGKRIDKTSSCVVSFFDDQVTITDSGGVGDQIIWTVKSTDECGNTQSLDCHLDVLNPAKF